MKTGDLAEVAGAYVHLWRTLVEAGRAGELVDLLLVFVPVALARRRPSLTGSIGAAALLLGRWDEADRLLGDAGAAHEAGGLTSVARTWCRAPSRWTGATTTWPGTSWKWPAPGATRWATGG